MDTNLHSFLIAQHTQDRITEATGARTARAAKAERKREPRRFSVRRRIHKPGLAPVAKL